MVKKILSLFLLGVAIHFCFGNTFFLVPTAYAETATVYMDDDYLVEVTNVIPLGENHFDTDVEFMIFSSLSSEETHYEFTLKNDTWVFRTHRTKAGPWSPVKRNAIAQAIFDYAYYNN